jgi:hypothetical protein
MSDADQAFYTAAAQVLPVLFLVAAVERRLFDRPLAETREGLIFDLVTIPPMILTMAIGEVTAFVALASDSSTEGLRLVTIISLAFTGVVVLLQAIVGVFDAIEKQAFEYRRDWVPTVRRARYLTIQGVFMLMIAGVLIYTITAYGSLPD